jgi:hypothetical protein
MSIAAANRILALEARVAALEETVADCRAFCDARQGAEAPTRAAAGPPPSRAPADALEMVGAVEALRAGQSIRGAAKVLGLDRNTVFRLRRRAIAEGRLTVVSPETGFRKP